MEVGEEVYMYNSDKPIEDFDDDILGRGYFAKRLGETILSIDTKDTITIGLYGKWGSGKTSIINLVLKEIDNKVLDNPEIEKPLVIRFAPWNFTNNQNLIVQFFKQLRSELKIKDYAGFSRGLGEALESYSGAIELAQAIPIVGEHISIVKMIIESVSKRLKNKSDDGIVSTKNKVIEQLQKKDKKIIVIIDDIDRLSNEQIRMVFQLVKEVASLPNIIYLLAMDKEVVARALTQVQNCEGEEYLEKIVQVPFAIPRLDKDKVLNLFSYKIDGMLDKKEEAKVDKEYLGKVYWRCIYPYINTIRDVNRIMNTLQFRYRLVAEEVNFVDMLAITVIQVMKPKIYYWILENEKKICGGSSYGGVVHNEQDNKKKQYAEELVNIGGVEALDVITALFPKLDKEVNHNYEVVSDDVLRKDQRIADPDRFKIYFSLDISDIWISNSMLVRSIKEMNEYELQDLLSQLNKSKKIIPYLRELKSHSDEVPNQRICLLMQILYKNMQCFEGEVRNSIMYFSAQWYAERCIDSLLNRVESSEKKYYIFAEIIKNADFKTLNSMAMYINSIELGYGRLAAKSVDERKQIISIKQLEELEVMYTERIMYLVKHREDIFECNNLLSIIYLWNNFDNNTCRNYIKKLLKEPNNILKFIVRMSSQWKSETGERGWSFNDEYYSEFVSTEEVINIINSYFNGEIKEIFSPEEESKMATFIMLGTGKYDNHIYEKEALKYIENIKQ